MNFGEKTKGEGKKDKGKGIGRKGKIFMPFPSTFNNILCSFLFNLWRSTHGLSWQ